MINEARLPVPVPRWFLGLRAITHSLLYFLLLLWVALVHPVFPRRHFVLIALGLCWLVLLVSVIIELRHRRRSGEGWRARVSDLSLLFAPLFIFAHLPWLGLAMAVVGYVMLLRRVSGGEIFLFALVGTAMAAVMATMAIMEVESAVPGAPLAMLDNASRFTASTLFRLSSVHTDQPVTEDGRGIAVGIQVISSLLLGAIYAGILTALVRGPAGGSKGSGESKVASDDVMAKVIAQQEEILRRLDRLQAERDDR